VLVEQVKNAAAWLWDDPRAAEAVRALSDVDAAELGHQDPPGMAYFRLLLAAHFATVATFVPTDVDVRIRHHVWWALEDHEALAAASAVVDEVAAWDVRSVSARVVESPLGLLSGHDGEWLGVRAGALGRATAVGAEPLAERLAAALDAEIDREDRILSEALAPSVPATRALAAVTIVAHNLGDLSRVVELWPKGPVFAALRQRYLRLGHPEAPAARRSFTLAGELNKSLVAHENHRFLPLRKPRGLRRARALLLPTGPWLDAWGEAVARHEALEERDRADVVGALLDLHRHGPEQLGCLRALAGIHRATRGGVELYLADVPARLRKDALRGRVREAIDVEEDHFGVRFERRYRAERARLG
jgi:hypothetical protein